MDRSQSLNAPPYFDGSNYAFWKVRIRAFICSIDETVWDAVDVGWTRPKVAKSTRDKATLVAANVDNKAVNGIFCVCLYMSFTRYLTLPLPMWHGKYWKPRMKTPRR